MTTEFVIQFPPAEIGVKSRNRDFACATAIRTPHNYSAASVSK